VPLTLALAAMGTRFELVLPGLDETRERAAGEAALAEIAEWDARLSLFQSDSLLAHVNREAGRRAVRVEPGTFELLETCARLLADSEGAFDAGLGAAMAAQGFRGDAARATARSGAGFAAVELDARNHSVRFADATVQLDLGGIAKGFALDRASEVLREAGVSTALLHGGTSTVLALGAPPGAAGWRVALDLEDAAPRALLCDRALSVSARHGRRNDFGAGHVLGASVARAAVEAPDATLADAWSTALLVLGRLPQAARAHGVSGWIDAGQGWSALAPEA
jgi:thiamine biosynthesis lipoprotein